MFSMNRRITTTGRLVNHLNIQVYRNGILKCIKRNMSELFTNQANRFDTRVLLGTISESMEETLQPFVSDIDNEK